MNEKKPQSEMSDLDFVTDPDQTLPPDATQPFEESMHRANTIRELNLAFGEKLGGKVLISKKDGRAVEFVEFVSENKQVLAKLRQLGGSTIETVDESQIRFDPKTGDFVSDEWEVVEVVKMSGAKGAEAA
jgi:hypothetical protein